jgi:two-component system, LuxR family, sensor kinase FixL
MVTSRQILALPLPWIGALYVSAYVLFEAVSYVHPFGAYGITPWNPSTGLSILVVLLWGRRMLPLLFLTPPLAEAVVRGLALPLWITGLEALIVGGGYTIAALILLWPKLRFDTSLTSLRDLSILMGVAVLSSAFVASAYVIVLVSAQKIEIADFWPAALRYWIGDMIGIALAVPFGLLAATREHFIKINWRTALHVLAILLALAIAASSAQHDQLQLFYFLFLPITWVAASAGLESVSVALVVTQIGLFVALEFIGGHAINIMDLQARMLVLSITGFAAGALVTERRRAEQKLLENQAALARLSRLGSMGELAAAIAHEVNQPLSAAGTYARLVTESLSTEKLKDPSVIGTAEKATAQIERAAAVIRRLRALVRSGRSEISAIPVAQMIQEAVDLAGPILQRNNVTLEVKIEGELLPVRVDRIQIEQALVNLIRNAAEALATSSKSRKRIVVHAIKADARRIEVRVCDTGPGFPKEFCSSPPPLFSSSKLEGLGVGLSLCQSIAEAHGGTLRVESGGEGAAVSFTLPVAKGRENE